MHESAKWKWSRSVVSDSSDPMDCTLPGSSANGIFQARVLEWGAIAFSAISTYWSLNLEASCYCQVPIGLSDLWGVGDILYARNLIFLNESAVQVRCMILDAWDWCTGMTQRDGTGREEGSGWGICVYLWQIHVDIGQNQYNILKLKKKNYRKKKKARI